MRMNVILAEEDVRRLDELSERTGRSRSDLIREAVRRLGERLEVPAQRLSWEELEERAAASRAKFEPVDAAALVRYDRDHGH